MRCFSKYIFPPNFHESKGFSLVEILASLIILALICSSVFVIIDRCLNSTTDMTIRMQAFEVARENMETLLSKASVKEKVDYGTSKIYPYINWESSVEIFEEPVNSEMWVRAVCSAQYIDSKGYEQKVELAHWLTNVSKKQMMEIIKQMDKREKILKEQLISDISEASAYADVSPETVQMWLDNGMPTANNGAFIKEALDLYNNSQGYPSIQNIAKVEDKYRFLSQPVGEEITTMPTGEGSTNQQTGTGKSPSQGSQGRPTQQNGSGQAIQGGGELYFGLYTEEDLRNMTFKEIWDLLMEHHGN